MRQTLIPLDESSVPEDTLKLVLLNRNPDV